MYGSGKPEQTTPPKKEESKLVRGVKKALNNWLDRIGPKGIENHFVKAHENILKTLNNEERIKTYEQAGTKWKKWGKALGITATVLDAGLAGLGIGITRNWIGNPDVGRKTVELIDLSTRNPKDVFDAHPSPLRQKYLQLATNIFPGGVVPNNLFDNMTAITDEHHFASRVGTITALIPGFATLFPIFGGGPIHTLAHVAAFSAEAIGKLQARGHNYVDSGKAAEHAKKVGGAIGKAATETAKYATEHPEQIISAVETANRIHRDNTESAQKIAAAKQKAADIALEKEYQDWIAHHPDKAYYENSGVPYPSKAEYVAKKAADEAAKKANLEAQERGVAKH